MNDPLLKILVVDDNHEGCETMRMLLAASGHKVEKAHCGLTALECAQRFKPDLILLDIGLPHKNGWEVAQELRADSTFDKTIIYALSGYGEPGDIQRSLDSGMNRHFVKPLDMDEFWDCLKEEMS